MSDGTVSAIGYVTIKNTGKITDRLIGASLSGATAAEIVGPPTEDGATFRPITEGVAIPAGTTITLQPGSTAIVFHGPLKLSDPDTYMDGALIFEKAGPITIEFFIEAASELGTPK